MASDSIIDTSVSERGQQWQRELAEFLVEANRNTYAADKGQVDPANVERPGYKELEYENGLWRLRDSYTGYFRAPGMTTVYYADKPAWVMAYGGEGQSGEAYDSAEKTFAFLKGALMSAGADQPIRGPRELRGDDYLYNFFLDGTLINGEWREHIYDKRRHDIVFSQIGFVGVVIGKTADRQPVYPWDLAA